MKKILIAIVALFALNNEASAQICDAVYADNNIVLVSVDFKLYRSADNGNTFTLILPGGEDNVQIRCITKVNNTLIIGGIEGSSRIFRSTDNGQTWATANSGMPEIAGVCAAVPTRALTAGNKVFMGGTNFFRVSDDEGQTWDTMSVDGATGGLAYTGGKIWHSKPIGGPGLVYSQDLGATWQTPVTNPYTYGYPMVGLAQLADTLIALSGQNLTGGIFRTNDIGANWQSIANSMQLGQYIIEVNDTLYATGYNGFRMSVDYGVTWTDQCSGYQYHTYGGKLWANGNDIWIASANGPIRYNRITGSCQVVQLNVTSNIYEVDFDNIISIYPNPANNIITIDNLLYGSTVIITDITGKKLYNSIVNGHQALINTSDFVNGVYIVHVTNNGATIKRKLVVNK